MVACVYIVRCADGSYYTGLTRDALDNRIAKHNAGYYDGYTAKRRPVELVWSETVERVSDAIALERRIKLWSRAKKEALIRGDIEALKLHARRRTRASPDPSRRPCGPPQGEESR